MGVMGTAEDVTLGPWSGVGPHPSLCSVDTPRSWARGTHMTYGSRKHGHVLALGVGTIEWGSSPRPRPRAWRHRRPSEVWSSTGLCGGSQGSLSTSHLLHLKTFKGLAPRRQQGRQGRQEAHRSETSCMILEAGQPSPTVTPSLPHLLGSRLTPSGLTPTPPSPPCGHHLPCHCHMTLGILLSA